MRENSDGVITVLDLSNTITIVLQGYFLYIYFFFVFYLIFHYDYLLNLLAVY